MQSRPATTTNSSRLPADRHRPRYHFSPPANWMNDPNGLAQWHGTYHLFYQWNPYATVWANIHWGHASSIDLLHWDDLPIALTPSGVDVEGCWSGALIDDAGIPTLLYTGAALGQERPCVARGSADLLTWQKDDRNPVIPTPPLGLDLLGFRDHTLWREDGYWYQGLGSGIRGVGGAVLLYRSLDLIEWEYLHPLCVGTVATTGEMWECPNFFPLGDKYVLLFSVIPTQQVLALIGSYHEQHFITEQQLIVDGGKSFYAPQTFVDEQHRRLMIGWLPEERTADEQQVAGWSGAMSLPRVLTMDAGRFTMQPISEAHQLRGVMQQFATAVIAATPVIDLGIQAMGELRCTYPLLVAGVTGWTLYATADVELLDLQYDAATQTLVTRTTTWTSTNTLQLRHDEALELHLFIDHSVIELFVNSSTCITHRVYMQASPQLRLRCTASDTANLPTVLTVWQWLSV